MVVNADEDNGNTGQSAGMGPSLIGRPPTRGGTSDNQTSEQRPQQSSSQATQRIDGGSQQVTHGQKVTHGQTNTEPCGPSDTLGL